VKIDRIFATCVTSESCSRMKLSSDRHVGHGHAQQIVGATVHQVALHHLVAQEASGAGPYLAGLLPPSAGPAVAATDYVRALPENERA
jgi:hypothetical protein